MSKLNEKHCAACSGAVALLSPEQQAELLPQLQGWEIVGNHHLQKNYKFPDFKSALSFVNGVGEVAESENHHPNISFTWGKVQVEIFSHKLNGLTEADFILAAKIDANN